jgi:hypothetical protein
MCIYYCYRFFFIKTVATFSATYTLQQLNRSLRNKQKNKQKNEQTSYRIRRVTSVILAESFSAPKQNY